MPPRGDKRREDFEKWYASMREEVVDEAVKGEDTQRRKDAAAERRKGDGKLLSKKEGERNADKMGRDIKFYAKLTKKARVDEQANSGDTKPQSPTENKPDPTLAAKEKRISQMKKMVLLKKMQAVRSGAGSEITASYEPEGEMVENLTSVKAASFGMPHAERQAIIDKYKKDQLKKGKQPVKAPIQKEEVKDKQGLDKYDRHKRMIRHKQDKYGRNVIGADYNLENERKAKGWKKKLNKEEIETEGWKPDPVEKRKKKAADLYRREKIAQGTSAKYKTDKTEDPDKLYKRRMAVDSKTKMKEDKAFDNVVSMLKKKHGDSGVITKDSPKSKAQPQPKKKPEKDTRSSAQREVDAQYGRTPWNKKGSLGT